jgi:lipopolysaccharide transport system ATP-binding protein
LKPILEIQGISKQYQIEGNKKPYLSLRESLFNFLKPSSTKESFWALDDVSFSLMPGDTLGIIGRNGAGKSTLLKILSKITPPTKGKIITRGRIASLLEVGTGFHPELSGRENVYMNGSILGMKRSEIEKHFDAIVDFSGVERFLDTPLKHYSSGMQLRLAFAVAAFLEPEILVIDEVLAVGDSEFQKKCLNKMEDVSQSGRTIIFVSHQLSAIRSLCSKGVFMQQGKLREFGAIETVIQSYSNSIIQEQKGAQSKHLNESRDHYDLRFREEDQRGHFNFTDPIALLFRAKKPLGKTNLQLALSIKDRYEKTILIDFFDFKESSDPALETSFELPAQFLTPGKYFVDIALQNKYEQFWLETNALYFEIDTLSTVYESLTYNYGMVSSPISWQEK